MITNPSTKEKTIRMMYQLLSGDVWNADKFIKYGNYLGTADIVDENILDNYFDYFELEDIEVPEKFFYQPAAFAEYIYGSPDLDFIVLYFSKIPSMCEFNKKKIKILSPARLTELNKIAVKYKEQIDYSYSYPT